MTALAFLKTNLGRAQRILLRPRRIERMHSFLAWERYLADERRKKRANRRRDIRRRENQTLLLRELREEVTVLASHPTTLQIDPASVCNLRCPFCPTGANFGNFPRAVMSPESFARVMSNIDPDLIQRVEFYNWGEPLLNPHLPEFIRFFSERHADSEVSTNFSQCDYSEDYMACLANSGLSTLIVSVDGARQETYERYRVRGNLERVLGNMRRLAEVKRALKLDEPAIVFKMLLNRYNQDEVQEAEMLAADVGASFLLNEKFWCPDEARAAWAAGDPAIPSPIQAYSLEPQEVVSTYCRQLWESVIVAANGDVHPCCLTYETEHAIGNLERQPVMGIRNSERAVYLREFVTRKNTPAPTFPNSCEQCTSRWCQIKRRAVSSHHPIKQNGLPGLAPIR